MSYHLFDEAFLSYPQKVIHIVDKLSTFVNHW